MRIIFGGNSDIGKAINGVHISREECDITSYNQIFKVYQKYKPTEVVNCAGVICPSPLIDSQYWDFGKEISVNLMGAYLIARIGIMFSKKFVFIGSTAGLRGKANWSGYCASKAGLISLVQSIGNEGYDAWCLNIGRTDTKMRKGLYPTEDKSTLMSTSYVASIVEECFNGKYPTGSSILVKKDEIIEVTE